MLSLFANLKLVNGFYPWNVFSLQIGKAHYDYGYCYNLHFFIFCDISSAVENYFQKILRKPHPTTKSTSPFLLCLH